jgi:5-hydroxyisourate hydrolase-like protein (transthyretin family)
MFKQIGHKMLGKPAQSFKVELSEIQEERTREISSLGLPTAKMDKC